MFTKSVSLEGSDYLDQILSSSHAKLVGLLIFTSPCNQLVSAGENFSVDPNHVLVACNCTEWLSGL